MAPPLCLQMFPASFRLPRSPSPLLSVWPVLQSMVPGARSEICPIRRIYELIMERGPIQQTPP